MTLQSENSSWPKRPLIEVASLQRGYDLPVQQRVEGQYPVFAANGQLGTHNEAMAKGPGVVTGRSGTIGKVHYVDSDFWPLNTALFVTDFHGNDPKWVFYMLKSFDLERFAQGAGVPTLNRNLVHGELISVPPLEEQKRIAAILDKAENLRRKRQQAIRLADDFLRAVFLDMFGDQFESNQDAWRPIGEITSFIDYRGKTPEKSAAGIPLLTAKNVKRGHLDVEPQEFIPEDKYLEWMTRGFPLEGDILFTTEAPLGNVAILPKYEKVALAQRVICIRGANELAPEYLLFALQHPKVVDQIETRATGSTVKGIRSKELVLVKIPTPPIKEQVRFSEISKKILKARAQQDLHGIQSESFFNSLVGQLL